MLEKSLEETSPTWMTVVGRSRKGGGLGTALEKSSKGALFGTFKFFCKENLLLLFCMIKINLKIKRKLYFILTKQ